MGLLVATRAPASVASEACDELAANRVKFQTGVQTTDPMKAQNATVTVSSSSRTTVTVSWTIAPNLPTAAISEWCVKKVHVTRGLERELFASQTGIINVADNHCFGNDRTRGTPLGCSTGTFKFSIQMKTDCGSDGPWVATDPEEVNLN
ncbi:MAG: hypothetical protein F4Y03_08135 [Alphaproteobacteria bacterium]|nr:hypothetical protein [Alphaproteobacteria bacterium]